MSEDFCLAAAIFATDPAGTGGVVLRARAGGQRERWLELLSALLPEPSRLRRLPAHITDDRLLGGLDLAATLAGGRPVAERGLLAEADGGVLLLPMAERLSAGLAARIVCALDRRQIRLERDGFARTLLTEFGVVALDEGIEDDERPPAALLDRLACHIDLSSVRAQRIGLDFARADIVRARKLLPKVTLGDEAVEALCVASLALGIASLNAPFLAAKVARAAAALDGEEDGARRAISRLPHDWCWRRGQRGFRLRKS